MSAREQRRPIANSTTTGQAPFHKRHISREKGRISKWRTVVQQLSESGTDGTPASDEMEDFSKDGLVNSAKGAKTWLLDVDNGRSPARARAASSTERTLTSNCAMIIR